MNLSFCKRFLFAFSSSEQSPLGSDSVFTETSAHASVQAINRLFRFLLKSECAITAAPPFSSKLKILPIMPPLAACFSFISSFVRSDIFDKSKVLLKPSVSVVFYSPLNCQRQYHLRSKYHCHRQYHSPKANKTFLRLRRNLNPSRSDTALLPSSLFLITCPQQAAF